MACSGLDRRQLCIRQRPLRHGYPRKPRHADRGIPLRYGHDANGSDDWGYSWGYYVSIYHDSTYSTLYAHMSAVAVSEGQWVNKGDVIGYVGDTGYSFGDHCHFEVYQTAPV